LKQKIIIHSGNSCAIRKVLANECCLTVRYYYHLFSATPDQFTVAIDYLDVTELAGDPVSREQIERLERRYFWARSFCQGKDVLELACGTAQGAGLLAAVAKNFVASDGSLPMLDIAKKYYGDRVSLLHVDATALNLKLSSIDVLILFEALYYLPDADSFFEHAYRVLRPNGVLLIATANKDLYDFNPSPYSYEYLGTIELSQRLSGHGFTVELFGDTPIAEVSDFQKALRPIKNLASRTGLIPKSMAAKRLIKRLIFGKLVPMPAEIIYDPARKSIPAAIALGVADHQHKVIFCAARKMA
jgi:ubiquinone/menaquinone biosynthesis C-methylase UbiE